MLLLISNYLRRLAVKLKKKDNYPWKQYNYDEILNKGPYFHKLGIKGPSGMLVEKSGKILAKNIKTSEELVKHLERYWGN